MKWSNQRIVFGKKLIDQPVIRQKLAKMIAHCEANQAWLENITYQMTLMPYKEQAKHLAGPIGLLKMFATRSAHEIADEAVQVCCLFRVFALFYYSLVEGDAVMGIY